MQFIKPALGSRDVGIDNTIVYTVANITLR